MKNIIYIILIAYSGLIMAQNKIITSIHGEQIRYDVRISNTERDSLAIKTVGMTIYNTTTKCHEFWDGTDWYNYCWGGYLPAGTVRGAAGKIWMNKNLGASRVAQSSDDFEAYGSLFQWGRYSDGHELITWTSATTGTPKNGTTTTLWSLGDPVHSDFIISNATQYDWRSTPNDNLWNGVNGENNPCPTGYRLPTDEEWAAEFTAAGITNSATAYASPLETSGSRLP